MNDANLEADNIQVLIDALYASICFDEGKLPDFAALRSSFIENGKLINNNGNMPFIVNIDEFIEVLKNQIATGAVKSFYEKEIFHRTDIFGKIAQRFSTYEARFDKSAVQPFSTGINSIQLIKIGNNWKVTSMVWNDENALLKIPSMYRPPAQ